MPSSKDSYDVVASWYGKEDVRYKAARHHFSSKRAKDDLFCIANVFRDVNFEDADFFKLPHREIFERTKEVDLINLTRWLFSLSHINEDAIDEFGRYPADSSALVRLSLHPIPFLDYFRRAIELGIADFKSDGTLGYSGELVSHATGSFDGEPKFQFRLSCDLDYVVDNNAHQLLRNLLTYLRGNKPSQCSLHFNPNLDPSVRCLRAINRIAHQSNIVLAIYVLPISSHKSDPVGNSRSFQIAKDVLDRLGLVAGCHLPFSTIDEPGWIEKANGAIFRYFNVQPSDSRYHFLRWSKASLKKLPSFGIRIDSSVAFANAPGFPCGTGSMHPLVGFGKLWQRPLNLMDVSILNPKYCSNVNRSARIIELQSMIARAQLFDSGFEILWHNTTESYRNIRILKRLLSANEK